MEMDVNFFFEHFRKSNCNISSKNSYKFLQKKFLIKNYFRGAQIIHVKICMNFLIN